MAGKVKTFGVPGFSLPFHERMAMLVEMVGGLGPAAKLTGRDRDTVNNWRKEGARVPIDGVLPLAIEAGVSMDWVATGYQVRQDLVGARSSPATGMADPSAAAFQSGEGLVRLAPLQATLVQQPGTAVERWVPSELGFSLEWLKERFGLRPDQLRYAYAGDNDMVPLVGRGAIMLVDVRPSKLRAGLYTVKIGDEIVARRLQRMPNGAAELVANAEPAWRFSLPADAAANEGLLLHPIIWVGQPA